jgi:hypothetical protein
MPSSYSPNLRLELIAPGEQTGAWGGTTNTNLGTLIEQAISGVTTVSMTDANLTLSANSGAVDQARSMALVFTSSVSLTATRAVTCPSVPKLYVLRNATTGGQAITFTAGAGSVVVPNGASVIVVCDGTDVRLAIDTFTTSGGFLSAQPTFRNVLINGGFTIAQRGLSQTTDGYGSADRWYNGNAGSTKVTDVSLFALGQTDVPGEPRNFLRTAVTSVAGANNYVVVQQRIEGVRTFAGQQVTVSFWAKADGTKPIAIDLRQVFGIGGAPSAEVSGIGARQFSLTTSWQKFRATIAVPSIAGKTLGAADDHLELTIWFDAGASWNSRTASLGQQSGTFDIAQVQLEGGPLDTPFEVRPPEVELALCQRYFHTTVGNSIGFTVVRLSTSGSFEGVQPLHLPHPVTMRGTPAVIVYPTSARTSAGNVLVNGASNSTGFLKAEDAQVLVVWNSTALASVGDFFVGYVDANAEL